jgi:gamma-glutamylcyclotransferase (GGCT)/AIG2-like uncharacterized protein YtfP
MTPYFAYGSNMSIAGMARRCPGAVALGRARLDGWRFAIFSEGYATIVPAAGHGVHGVLWRVTPRDLVALNIHESVETNLYVRRMVGVQYGSKRLRALVYVAPNRVRGRPRPGYLDLVVSAAREWGLPPQHVRAIERDGAVSSTRSVTAHRPEPGELGR